MDLYDPPDLAGMSTDHTTYTYNLDRQLDLVTRPDGQTVDLVHDATTGQLTSQVIPRGTYSYAYDGTSGQLTSITAPDGGTLTFTHDGELPTSSVWAGTVAGTITRTYDDHLRLSTETVTGSDPVEYLYDDDGLLESVGKQGGTAAEVLSITRSPLNGLITATSMGVVTDVREYDPFGDLKRYEAKVSGSQVYEAAYERDALGRITKKSETIDGSTVVWEYSYDTAGRLEEVRQDTIVTATYGYDTNGNRTHVNGVAVGTYDDQDRLVSYDHPGGTASYTYTPNGELETKVDASGTTTYDYEVLGNLMAVDLPGGDEIDYVIDGRDRRIGRKVNTTLDEGLLYGDQLNPVAELDGAGSLVSRFVYGTKGYMVKGGSYYRIISDHLGSPRLVVDTSIGTIAQELEHDEFGKVVTDTNPSFQPFGFAGGIVDADTGLVRFGARDYDPSVGRWAAKDPIRFDGGDANLYAYVVSDPLNSIDPSGLMSWVCDRPLGGDPGNPTPPGVNHQYLCITLPDGTIKCGGQTSDDPNVYPTPGRPTRPDEDWYDPLACQPFDNDDNRCMEDCLLKRFKAPRPNYAIGLLGVDRQEWTYKLVLECTLECSTPW